jgi:hypothetical protein
MVIGYHQIEMADGDSADSIYHKTSLALQKVTVQAEDSFGHLPTYDECCTKWFDGIAMFRFP